MGTPFLAIHTHKTVIARLEGTPGEVKDSLFVYCERVNVRNLVNAALLLVFVFPQMISMVEGKASFEKVYSSSVVLLDGNQWLLAPDPENLGRRQQWWNEPQPTAKQAKVPWIVQDTFSGFHGVAWYWHDFNAPENPHKQGRYLLRFWAVDYKTDVWVNGVYAGSHEGAEDPFVFDVTESIKPNQSNRIAVRVLNPLPHAIEDGIVLLETPHRVKHLDSMRNISGIVESVELLVTAAVYVEDLFVLPDPQTGKINVQVNVRNTTDQAIKAKVACSVAPAAKGETLNHIAMEQQLNPGDTLLETQLEVDSHHLWNLNDPYLYRVTARAQTIGSYSFDEKSVQCGFRDFRFENGYFRLNGKRIFLRSAHTGNSCPIGFYTPHDPDLIRRDLINLKVMGFNAVRFISGVAKPHQLDLCDEIGLMVIEECYAGWYLIDSPWMEERFDHSVAGMIKRDRNHPSITIWGLLNECFAGPVFHHAVRSLSLVRSLDDTRLVLLNSGRPDGYTGGRSIDGVDMWRTKASKELFVTYNPADETINYKGTIWEPGVLVANPGLNSEYSTVRWRAPDSGEYSITARFEGVAKPHTTVDIYILHEGALIYQGALNIHGQGNTAEYSGTFSARKAERVDIVVSVGDDDPFGDSTGLDIVIEHADGTKYNAADEFSLKSNPNGLWTYGYIAAGSKPDPATFTAFDTRDPEKEISVGSLSNPGSTVWEDVLDDHHWYPRVPHTAPIIREFRNMGGKRHPMFLSEYGVGSAVDLARVPRLYEQNNAPDAKDGLFYRGKWEKFEEDWHRWNLADTFVNPEDFFRQSNTMMGPLRLFGINALRANPNIVGYSMTGAVDQGLSGEGLTTTFRELKPGTIDAIFDGFAPLRWCLFVEPINIYRGRQVHLDAVIANEDVLKPGEYPATLAVLGLNNKKYFERKIIVTIPEGQPAFAIDVLSEEVVIDGPDGEYRFVATFDKGAAAAGGDARFYLTDPANMPAVDTEVVLWGSCPALQEWFLEHGIRTRRFDSAAQTERELIVVSDKPSSDDTKPAFRDLACRIARGSTVVFLSPGVFNKKTGWFGSPDEPLGWLPLKDKGLVKSFINIGLYRADHWTRNHPIFDGLSSGRLMDCMIYRNIIPDRAWSGQDIPTEAVSGAILSAFGEYESGLTVAVYELGAGRFILNTLKIEQNLGKDPVAERLLRNMLRYGARDLSKTLEPLPEDFDTRLVEIRY